MIVHARAQFEIFRGGGVHGVSVSLAVDLLGPVR
jgi:hypothetical protein